jgi:hypothetical protein
MITGNLDSPACGAGKPECDVPHTRSSYMNTVTGYTVETLGLS